MDHIHYRLGAVQSVPISTTAAASTPFPQDAIKRVRISANIGCFIAVGPAGTVVTPTTGTYLPPSQPEIIGIASGEVISVIADESAGSSGTGNLNITQLNR